MVNRARVIECQVCHLTTSMMNLQIDDLLVKLPGNKTKPSENNKKQTNEKSKNCSGNNKRSNRPKRFRSKKKSKSA